MYNKYHHVEDKTRLGTPGETIDITAAPRLTKREQKPSHEWWTVKLSTKMANL